jgi:hypothetical protein
VASSCKVKPEWQILLRIPIMGVEEFAIYFKFRKVDGISSGNEETLWRRQG